MFFFFFFFFKQKTAYEIVDCDWSSDVCSSDLNHVIGVIVEEKRNLLWVFLNDHLVRMFLEQHLGCQQHIFVVIDYQDFAKFFITHSRRGMMVSTKVQDRKSVV